MAENDTLAALDALLDAEAEALRRADFAALGPLAVRKAALERELGAALAVAPAAVDLRALAAKARRNEGRLRAAIGGLNSARRRLAELRQATEGMTTYDRAGQRNHHPAGPGQLTRRA